jgi:hypothetical protein
MSELDPDPISVRLALEVAWRDHYNAREQSWRAVQMEAVLGSGLVSGDAQFGKLAATAAAAVLVGLVGLFGIWISLHHRELERRKFIHIDNFERFLRLRRDDLIPAARPHFEGGVALPEALSFWAVFDPRRRSTSVFILRIHLAVMLFALIVFLARLYATRQAAGGFSGV